MLWISKNKHLYNASAQDHAIRSADGPPGQQPRIQSTQWREGQTQDHPQGFFPTEAKWGRKEEASPHHWTKSEREQQIVVGKVWDRVGMWGRDLDHAWWRDRWANMQTGNTSYDKEYSRPVAGTPCCQEQSSRLGLWAGGFLKNSFRKMLALGKQKNLGHQSLWLMKYPWG